MFPPDPFHSRRARAGAGVVSHDPRSVASLHQETTGWTWPASEGIAGWHGMRKDELVAGPGRQLARRADAASPPGPPCGKAAARSSSAAARNTSPRGEVESSKYDVGVPTRDLSAKVPKDLPAGYGKDRIVVMVRDPYWLHCYWELTRHAIQRAEAALGQEWHTAKPILRLLDVSSHDTTSTSESIVRDIDIHGGCNNWYIDVSNPPRSYRVDIGYLARSGRFYVLARSNVVTTPRAGVSDVIDENWADIDSRRPTASTPCPAASTRPPAASN